MMHDLSSVRNRVKRLLVISACFAAALGVGTIGRALLIANAYLPRLTLTENDMVGAVAISSDGRTVYGSARHYDRFKDPVSDHPFLYAWDAATGRLTSTLIPAKNRLFLVDYLAPEQAPGKILLTNRHPELWDVSERRMVWQEKIGYAPGVYTPDGNTIYTFLSEVHTRSTRNNLVWLDPETGQAERSIPGDFDPCFLGVSPDRKFFALADGTLKAVKTPQKELKHPEQGQMMPNGFKATGEQLEIWSVSFGKRIAWLPYNLIDSVVFSPDGNTMAVLSRIEDAPGGIDGSRIRLLDAHTFREKWSISKRDSNIGFGENIHHTLAFSPNGKTLACLTETHKVKLLNAQDGSVRRILDPLDPTTRDGNVVVPTGLAYSADGKTLVSRGDRRVFVWDVTRAEP